MNIIKGVHSAENMKQLKERINIIVNDFNNRWNNSNVNVSYIEYKNLNDNELILCKCVKDKNIKLKHTQIFNIKEKSIIEIQGICTLDIDELQSI